MPSGTIRCAKCSPTIPTLPGRSATTILSFCADLRTWLNGSSTRKRQCLVGIVIRAESRRVFAVHTSRMQVGVFTCRGHQPMLERRPFGAVGVASFEGSKFTVVVRDSSANLCRQWPSAHPDSARYAQLIMLDRFASELPTSMWEPRRVQCLPGFVVTIEITLLEIASKSRCYSWLPRFTTRGSSSRDP